MAANVLDGFSEENEEIDLEIEPADIPRLQSDHVRARNRRFITFTLLGVVCVLLLILFAVQAKRPGLEWTDNSSNAGPALDLEEWAGLQFGLGEDLGKWCRANVEKVEGLIARAVASGGWDAALLLNTAHTLLGEVAGISELLESTAPIEGVRDAASSCGLNVSAYSGSLGRNQGLFAAFKPDVILSSDEGEDTKRWVESTNQSFMRSGVWLPADARSRLQEVENEADKLSTRYQEVLDTARGLLTRAESDTIGLAGLSQEYLTARTKDGIVTISTDYPDLIPVLRYAKNATLRKELYVLSRTRGLKEGNVETLEGILKLRAESAELLGYSTWAAFATADQTIGSEAAVRKFLADALDHVRARSAKEVEELAELKKADIAAGAYDWCCACGCCECPDRTAPAIESWDASFYSTHLRNATYRSDSEELSKYFTYPAVRNGILDFLERMFDLRFVIDTKSAWHPDVEPLLVTEAKGGAIVGRAYLDMFPREGKYKHAAMFTIRTGVGAERLSPDAGVKARLPEGALVCNFPRGGAMEHGQVETFFHEFGHLLHHILAGNPRSQKWASLSGVNAVETDFVEAPSQFEEVWAADLVTLQGFAKKDGKTIPAELVGDMNNANKFGRGIDTQQQLFYSMVSLDFHALSVAEYSTFNSTTRMKELEAAYSPFPHNAGRLHANFGHIAGGYTSNYYSYQWSLAMAKDFENTFSAGGGFGNVETARRYRDKVLAPGGRLKGSELVRGFSGAWPPVLAKGYFKFLDEMPEPKS
eukprot:Hpha_TRINITY_DN31230_c0_g1::TRINITY_DN31230_c0_g1_i1::g.2436::m.2436/K01392/THOP1; thimet oligopeptidase